MKAKTVQRFFPHSQANMIGPTGANLSTPTKGVEILIHTRESETDPCCAELISGGHYSEIGLSFNGKELSDFDGAFFLPREVGEMLKDAGYVVPEDCFA
jgi:hypothetical protein